MSDYVNIFQKLRDYYDDALIWDDLEQLYENARAQDGDKGAAILDLPLVKNALYDQQVFSMLLDISAQIRTLRTESDNNNDGNSDSWEEVIKVSPRDKYLAFIYATAGLASLPKASIEHAKLALAASNCYFLSLTIPGAKGFQIFQEDIIIHCLQVFSLVQRLQNDEFVAQKPKHKIVEVWVRFDTFCDDLKLMLRYVHLADHPKVSDALLQRLLKDIHYTNIVRGCFNVYTKNLHTKCYEIFEEMINAHNGEPEETLLKLMHLTIYLHFRTPYTTNPPMSGGQGYCEHISDWFIKCIAKYPRLIVKVLSFYIEFMVTNPIKSWNSNQVQRALEYAAKYDAALFTKCNESCVNFLCDAIYAEEHTIRGRAVDLMSLILQLESRVDWQMFRHEVSDIPREVCLIKELIKSLRDNHTGIRLKAAQALQNVLLKGSLTTKTIMKEGLTFAPYNDKDVLLPQEPRVRKNEIRFQKPTAVERNFSFKGFEDIEEEFLLLPNYVYKYMLHCEVALNRRAGLLFMEDIIKINSIIIFNTRFVEEICRLVDDSSVLVRKATLQCIDGLVGNFPNCFPLIWLWCKLVSPMMRDSDPKNIAMAMDCFCSRVLQNLRVIDQFSQAEHFMPWVIIRTMLSTQSRLYLQNCFNQALQRNMVKPQYLSIVESHLSTPHSTEAWILYNFISGKIKSKEPDVLIHSFISLDSWNKEQNTYVALEVLSNCIQDFSPAALNLAFTHIINSIEEGTMLPVIIGKAFDFLVHINHRSKHQKLTKNSVNRDAGAPDEWIMKLYERLEFKILNELSDFDNNRDTLLSHLYSYSEVNMHMRIKPHMSVINFSHKYISECVKQSVNEWNLENERLFNSVIIIAGRFSLRDAAVANKTIQLYGVILDHIDRPQIVNTIIVALTDLCKKHSQMVENVTDKLLRKLLSSYAVNRLETFKCFERLILEDHMRLRGSLLIGLLVSLLDEVPDLQLRAADFFDEYCAKKNASLFQKCLCECPFVLNQYENFEGIDSYGSGKLLKSPLFGEKNRKKRHQLYNHIISKISDINLVLYFGQLKLLADKAARDPLLKTPKGLDVAVDIIFILRRVCQVIKEQKISSEPKDGEVAENLDDDAIPELSNEPSTSAAAAAAAANAGPGPGRGRRRREVTMKEALDVMEKSIVFISEIYYALRDKDPIIQEAIDEFCGALAERFPDMVNFAVPKEFWQKYQKSKSARNKNTHDDDNQKQLKSATTGSNPDETLKKNKQPNAESNRDEASSTDEHQEELEEKEPEQEAEQEQENQVTHKRKRTDDGSDNQTGSSTRRLKTDEIQIDYLLRPNYTQL